MKRIGLFLATLLLFGTVAVAQSDRGQGQGSGNAAQDNYGQNRRRLAEHEKRERRRLKELQREEREGCRAHPGGVRCTDLQARLKEQRERLREHQQRERERARAREYHKRNHQPGSGV